MFIREINVRSSLDASVHLSTSFLRSNVPGRHPGGEPSKSLPTRSSPQLEITYYAIRRVYVLRRAILSNRMNIKLAYSEIHSPKGYRHEASVLARNNDQQTQPRDEISNNQSLTGRSQYRYRALYISPYIWRLRGERIRSAPILWSPALALSLRMIGVIESRHRSDSFVIRRSHSYLGFLLPFMSCPELRGKFYPQRSMKRTLKVSLSRTACDAATELLRKNAHWIC